MQSPMSDKCQCGHLRSDHWEQREGDRNDGSWCWQISCPCWDYKEDENEV